ncbi:hypothetical protein NDU88_007339 [Pleurodeles waltl]|uniref:Reverse transcriptase domain-containing protein n=1 Tax=Pleurodeles waltl TaxID=8319 RepID=A0AAV7SSI3_PLEWA|nr:hypothetical protein NDU88_007339 [Pleurodeles waltl]
MLTLEELHIAVKSFKSGKTLDSDGLPIEFYTSLWDLVGPDLLELYEEMEQEGVMPHTLREGMIAPLYKHKGERCDLKNWRPISLLNVDYKILVKTMVNRLKGTMGEIVHPDLWGSRTQGSGQPSTDQGHDPRDPDTRRRKERSQVHSVHGRRTLFCTDGKSAQSLLEACKDFGKASGAKINMDKSEAKLFGCWDLCKEPLPFPIEAGLVKILGIWFGRPGAAAKSWNERLAKVKQKLGFWSLRHLSIEGKALVLRNDALPVLQYVTQAWPLLANVSRAVNSMVFHFVWHSKMNRGKRTVMHKVHRKGGKAVPDIPTILRSFFVCVCVRITLTNENKDHSAYRVFRFFLLPVWRRLGWEKWENATMFNWDLPWYYKEIEKFAVEFGLNCVTPSLWKPRTIHRLIRARDTTEPVSGLPPATATRVTRLVTNVEVVSREACRRMVLNLLRDYTDKDNKEREKEEEL